MNSSLVVVATDATLVYDALHQVVEQSLGSLDPSFALQDFTAKDAGSLSDEPVISAIMEALNTPPFLVERRVVVVRDAQHLSSAEAERLLRERGVKPQKRKAMLDAAAAAVILSELLEDRRAKGIPVASLS